MITNFLQIVESVLIEEKKKTKRKSKPAKKKTKSTKKKCCGGFPLVPAGYWDNPFLPDMSAGGGGDGT